MKPKNAIKMYETFAKTVSPIYNRELFHACNALGLWDKALNFGIKANLTDKEIELTRAILNRKSKQTNKSFLKAFTISCDGEETLYQTHSFSMNNAFVSTQNVRGILGSNIPSFILSRNFENSPPGRIGAALSHINCWEKLLKYDLPFYLILEVDSTPIYTLNFEEVVQWINKYDCILINQRLCKNSAKNPNNFGKVTRFNYFDRASGFDGYIINRKILKEFYEKIQNSKWWNFHIDDLALRIFLNENIKNGKIACLHEAVIQHSAFSQKSSRIRAELSY